MATITSNTYLDGGVARTAGEAMTIGSGATLTIRTDSRMHANAPASMTGSMGSVSFADIGGEYYVDATAVRWLPFNTGTSTVPAIGTSITQGAVSGYLLGVWGSISSAPTAVGASMPTSGFIKFREVTGGTFTSGSLSGIGASATGADVTGWIELVYDVAANITVPRVGKFKTRGGWFELGTTNGTIGQTFTVPSTSSALTNNYAPGVWVETAPSSNSYEFWTGLSSAANGWARTHIGYPAGYTDTRGKYVKTFGSGQVVFGESVSLAATYASLAAQAGTYAGIAISGTYTWASNKVTVDTGSTAHLLETGMQVGLDFTSGSGVDAIFTITVLNAFAFEATYSGSGTGGNVTVRPGVTITFTAHGVLIGENVYCDFTSGTGVDGTYQVYALSSANAYLVNYPHTAALTSGNVSCLHTLVVTYTAHGHALGNEVYLDFTSGTGVDGKYTMKTIATNTFNVNWAHSATTSGNVNINFTIGHVPASGCKVRIPNIIIAECATASRATNSVPNTTLATRPELTTSSAGALDLEYLYTLSLYTGAVGQAYSLRMYNCAFQDSLNISEIATALDIDNVGVGMYSAQDLRAALFSSCFAGGTVKNLTAMRGNTPGTTDHSFELLNCNNITFENITTGIIQYVRSSGVAANINNCQGLTFNTLRAFNGQITVVTSVNLVFNNTDYNDRIIGRTNATTAYYAISIGSGCNGIKIDNITFGMGNTIANCHPYSGIVNATGASNIKIRNIGTYSTPISGGTWGVNTYGCASLFVSGGNNYNVNIQRCYVTFLRTALLTNVNSDKNVLYEKLFNSYFVYGTKGASLIYNANLNGTTKAITNSAFMSSGQTSVYGTHFVDLFQGTTSGAIILVCNEPSVETASYVTINAGTVKFNSSGGVEMRSINAQCTWEIPYFILGHTSFANITPVMTGGGGIANFSIEYQIDTGSGWNGTWLTLNTTNLTAETIPTTGFKLKIRITTTSANTAAVQYLRIYTNTTYSAQNDISYPLDTASLYLYGLVSGSDIVILDAGTTSEIANVNANPTTTYTTTIDPLAHSNIDVCVYKAGYVPFVLRSLSFTSSGLSLPITQISDRNYID